MGRSPQLSCWLFDFAFVSGRHTRGTKLKYISRMAGIVDIQTLGCVPVPRVFAFESVVTIHQPLAQMRKCFLEVAFIRPKRGQELEDRFSLVPV